MGDIMKLDLQKYDYSGVTRVDQPGHRYYQDPQGARIPSVTTILSATRDMTHILAWRKRIGEQAADQISRESTSLGTMMHTHLENHILGHPRPQGTNLGRVLAESMANTIITNALCNVQEVWGTEVPLRFENLWAGTCDLVGVHDNQPAIMDFKTTIKPKTRDKIDDYRMQLTAYALAHNFMFGTQIRKGVIFMCSRNMDYQQFEFGINEFEKDEMDWLWRVAEYYKA